MEAYNTISIHSNIKDYNVSVFSDLDFLSGFKILDNTFFVIDRIVYELYKKYLLAIPNNRLFLIDAKEQVKIIDTALDICENMTELSAKRNAHLISIGGGITQDITGFAASVLYRGIQWTFVPTTLLAACDSCIGGKTSLNYKRFKNLLGTFYPPDKVLICPAFFQTLTDKDYESGLGEVVKFNIMMGREGLLSIEQSIDALLKRDASALMNCIMHSLAFKKDFIEIDEFDRGERIKLNFAHTFGHGIETVTNYEIPHGTAVAIGMIIANYISEQRELLDITTAERSEAVLLRVIHIKTDLRKMPFDEYLQAIKKDKKQIGDELTAVLMTAAPKDLRLEHDIKVQEIKDAIQHFCKVYY